MDLDNQTWMQQVRDDNDNRELSIVQALVLHDVKNTDLFTQLSSRLTEDPQLFTDILVLLQKENSDGEMLHKWSAHLTILLCKLNVHQRLTRPELFGKLLQTVNHGEMVTAEDLRCMERFTTTLIRISCVRLFLSDCNDEYWTLGEGSHDPSGTMGWKKDSRYVLGKCNGSDIDDIFLSKEFLPIRNQIIREKEQALTLAREQKRKKKKSTL